MRLKLLTLAALVLPLASAPALAQDETARVGQSGEMLVYEAEGHRLQTILPAWFALEQETGLSDQEVIVTGDDNSTRFEIVPEGQNAQDWTYLYGARIMLEPERDLVQYRQAAAFGYAMGCNGAKGQFFLTDEDTDADIAPMIFICGEFAESANRPDQGEILAIAFKRTNAGIAVIYEEFRTPAFDGKDPAAWPVTGEYLVARARALASGAELVEIVEAE